MTRLAALALLLAAVPTAPADAAATVTTWVVERTSARPGPLTIRGGAGVGDGDHAFAAVATADVDRAGRFTAGEGALFFGLAPDTQARSATPVGDLACRDVPVAATACAEQRAGGVLVFIVWWDGVPTFDQAFVVLRGEGKTVDLGERGSPGWRLRRWTAPVRVVAEGDLVSTRTPLGDGLATFGTAEAPGGPGGSLAIGHLPCRSLGYARVGTGAATLAGGIREVVATCADTGPPVAVAQGSTEWVFDGVVTGVSDTPARLVVIDRKAR